MYYLASFCFMCLNDKNLKKVFEEVSENGVFQQVAHVISEIVTLDKEIPVYICCACYKTLQSDSDFKETYNEKIRQFKEYINMVQGPNGDRIKGFGHLQCIVSKLDLGNDTINAINTVFVEEEIKDSIFSSVDKYGNYCEDIFLTFKEELITSIHNEHQEYNNQIISNESELNNAIEIVFLNNTLDNNGYNTNANNDEYYVEIVQEKIEPSNDEDHSVVNQIRSSNRKRSNKTKYPPEDFVTNWNLKSNKELKSYRKRDFHCAKCNKRFAYTSRYDRHMNSHNEIRNFTCSVCDKKFLLNSHLKEHLNIHYNIRRYECPVCHRTFVQSSTRQQHLKRHFSNIKFQ